MFTLHSLSYIITGRYLERPDTDPMKAKRFEGEALYMKDKWKICIENDPGYNANLSLIEGYRIDLDRGLKWPWSG